MCWWMRCCIVLYLRLLVEFVGGVFEVGSGTVVSGSLLGLILVFVAARVQLFRLWTEPAASLLFPFLLKTLVAALEYL